jgi:hypothetical protein
MSSLKKSLTKDELKLFEREGINPGTIATSIIALILFVLAAAGLFS